MGEPQKMKTTGVFLLNLGGPDSLDAVRPFLFNLFSDREIIRLGPPFLQRPLAHLISRLRSKKTEDAYRLIGGKSPILDITLAQARALENALEGAADGPFRVYVGMRYWRPFIADAVKEIRRDGISRLVLLGLYPQYSVATTGSSIAEAERVMGDLPIERVAVRSWHDHPLYIDTLVEGIRKGLDSFGVSRGDIHVLFSAHSLPQRFIEEGDPYQAETEETVRQVVTRLDFPWSLSYQSKSGPVKWLEPSTEQMIEDLGRQGVRNLLVVPVSFVSDHIETLYEIDILYKNMAETLGMKLRSVDSLNTAPLFIAALKEIVLNACREAGW